MAPGFFVGMTLAHNTLEQIRSALKAAFLSAGYELLLRNLFFNIVFCYNTKT